VLQTTLTFDHALDFATVPHQRLATTTPCYVFKWVSRPLLVTTTVAAILAATA
jgi:hypothetical protein